MTMSMSKRIDSEQIDRMNLSVFMKFISDHNQLASLVSDGEVVVSSFWDAAKATSGPKSQWKTWAKSRKTVSNYIRIENLVEGKDYRKRLTNQAFVFPLDLLMRVIIHMNLWHDITQWYAVKYLHQRKHTNEIGNELVAAPLDKSTVSENPEGSLALTVTAPDVYEGLIRENIRMALIARKVFEKLPGVDVRQPLDPSSFFGRDSRLVDIDVARQIGGNKKAMISYFKKLIAAVMFSIGRTTYLQFYSKLVVQIRCLFEEMDCIQFSARLLAYFTVTVEDVKTICGCVAEELKYVPGSTQLHYRKMFVKNRFWISQIFGEKYICSILWNNGNIHDILPIWNGLIASGTGMFAVISYVCAFLIKELKFTSIETIEETILRMDNIRDNQVLKSAEYLALKTHFGNSWYEEKILTNQLEALSLKKDILPLIMFDIDELNGEKQDVEETDCSAAHNCMTETCGMMAVHEFEDNWYCCLCASDLNIAGGVPQGHNCDDSGSENSCNIDSDVE